ncbi:2-dehydropantoate 2-reductase [Lebetimonas natsushimae]|uniref:2-dehydropantoate 2-reductase n=1 Tax=Lebetimonas natsushimae TaxID=1936991 RepID=A0A292YBA1_9BACT|nr:2-dehydropantoate 2-reductase N-terminal domain-containing protein [Lebetimonas natsushimae]GAX87377.1 2-dehydropantoate 2-reductase [Lebetimonas natsushimae]
MKILVIGPGGVGGYFAYKLKKCGHYVSVIGSKGTVKKLKIKDVDKEEEIEFDDLIDKYDVVFITTKSYHLDNVIKKYKDFLENSIVVPILNGIGHFKKFKDFNYKKACIYILSNKENGIIHKKTPLFYLCLEDDETLREVFKKCDDLKIKFSENIDKDIWKKYLFISTFATLQSFYQKPTGWIMENKKDEVEKFLGEVIRIAKNEGIDLSDEKIKVIKQALNIPYNSKMSMQIDFEKGNKTEVDNLTGFLAEKSDFINKFYKELK